MLQIYSIPGIQIGADRNTGVDARDWTSNQNRDFQNHQITFLNDFDFDLKNLCTFDFDFDFDLQIFEAIDFDFDFTLQISYFLVPEYIKYFERGA